MHEMLFKKKKNTPRLSQTLKSFTKFRVYFGKNPGRGPYLQSLQHLKERITDAIETVTPDVIRRTWTSAWTIAWMCVVTQLISKPTKKALIIL